ncbi:MAG: NAD(P)H-hydrate epimerase, partial [Chlamydiia bacterium]|nr:NAD(P)H-hydrate epimerase [Chlamydiia bacterium]
MKVVTPAEMSRIEKLAYDAGASEEEFMDQAGRGVASVVLEFIELHRLGRKIALLAGKGNNGGDAYVAGRVLLEAGLEVFAFQLSPIEECSPLCQKNLKAFQQAGGEIVGETP